MQKQQSFKKFFFEKSYILLIAVWLFVIAFLINNYWSGRSSITAAVNATDNYIHRQEFDYEKTVAVSSIIDSFTTKKYDENLVGQLTSKKYFIYVYGQDGSGKDSLVFWNTQVVEPDRDILQVDNVVGFIKLSNGYYVWRKDKVNGHLVVALIPIKWDYSITNEYLHNSFVINKGFDNNFTIVTGKKNAIVVSKEGSFLFSLVQLPETITVNYTPLAIMILILAVILLLVFIHLIAVNIAQRNVIGAVFFLIVVVLGLRIISYILPKPIGLSQFDLFNSTLHGYNNFLGSLGDLLVNSFLLLWLILFVIYSVRKKHFYVKIENSFLKWSIIISAIILLLLSTFFIEYLIRFIVSNSQVSFDVVNFFTLNIYSVIGFLILGCISANYFLFTQTIIYLLLPLLRKQKILLPLLTASLGFLLLSFILRDENIVSKMLLVIWLAFYLSISINIYFSLTASKFFFTHLIFWIFFLSASITILVVVESHKKELDQRKHYAKMLSAKIDPLNEKIIGTVLSGFKNDSIAPLFNLFERDSSNKKLKDSLLNRNIVAYLSNYDTRVYTYDENEHSLYNQDSTSFNTLNTLLKLHGKPTSVPNLYCYDLAYDRFTYISKKNVTDRANKLVGYVFIIVTPKEYKTDALYPELFLEGYNNSIENSTVYSYAVYNNLQIVNSHNDYSFPLELSKDNVTPKEFTITNKKSENILWYNSGKSVIVAIAKENKSLIESITLFSYLFCTFLLLGCTFWVLNALIRSQLKWNYIRSYWQVSIRNQVHATIILSSLLSFVIVGITTIFFFIDRYHSNNRDQLNSVIGEMQREFKNSQNETPSLYKLKQGDYTDNTELSLIIEKMSSTYAVDINLYDLDGDLKVSSSRLPYTKGIISDKMDPIAFHHLYKMKEINFIQQEKIGSLKYLSNYVALIDEKGNEYAYLNIPYFTSQTKLRQEISNYLVTVINLNAFIFLVAGLVALIIANRITRSFSFLSKKMKAVNLGKMNEAIVWERDDEIGELIREYNAMVNKLDKSAVELAKNEREIAWREMAKQVAHEIKNPLTPMKLGLQYLQRSIDNNSNNLKELTISVTRTLVEQIDHLNQIAGEFSQFANIGTANNEIFDVNEVLKLVIQLYSIEGNISIQWKPGDHAVMINADRTNINRLFTNLIQNAVQSVSIGEMPNIEIKEEVLSARVLISIKDNGSGISLEAQPKIFSPNFTTKSSGAGLGLAMCKSIIEQSKGDIWFKTSEGSTTFFVELPLAIV